MRGKRRVRPADHLPCPLRDVIFRVWPSPDRRSITLHRRIEGLTIEPVPTFPRRPPRRRRPEPGQSAWLNLASSGELLGASTQEMRVPEAWIVPRAATPRSRVIEPRRSEEGQPVVVGQSNGRDS